MFRRPPRSTRPHTLFPYTPVSRARGPTASDRRISKVPPRTAGSGLQCIIIAAVPAAPDGLRDIAVPNRRNGMFSSLLTLPPRILRQDALVALMVLCRRTPEMHAAHCPGGDGIVGAARILGTSSSLLTRPSEACSSPAASLGTITGTTLEYR